MNLWKVSERIFIFDLKIFNASSDGELRTEINKLADSLNYPLKKLYLVDGSKRFQSQ